jgi:transcriptional regulator with XRE-family HTH domain
MDIGERLRVVRKKHGLTQVELAARLGVSQTAISDYESGRTKPRHEKLVALASVLGTSTDELVGKAQLAPTDGSQTHIHGNTRIARLNQMFEQLSPTDQRAVLKHVKALLVQRQSISGE